MLESTWRIVSFGELSERESGRMECQAGAYAGQNGIGEHLLTIRRRWRVRTPRDGGYEDYFRPHIQYNNRQSSF
jgi:hypothetical protein